MTLKYATAATSMETLSCVIFCEGIGIVTILRGNFDKPVYQGDYKTRSPGSLTPITLPSLNTTPLSYWLTIFMDKCSVLTALFQ